MLNIIEITTSQSGPKANMDWSCGRSVCLHVEVHSSWRMKAMLTPTTNMHVKHLVWPPALLRARNSPLIPHTFAKQALTAAVNKDPKAGVLKEREWTRSPTRKGSQGPTHCRSATDRLMKNGERHVGRERSPEETERTTSRDGMETGMGRAVEPKRYGGWSPPQKAMYKPARAYIHRPRGVRGCPCSSSPSINFGAGPLYHPTWLVPVGAIMFRHARV